jgi:small GTP-binding protein
MRKVKVIVLGDARVGKTSLLNRWVENTFTETYRATIGATFLKKQTEDQTFSLTLELFEVGGGPLFSAMIPAYIRGAQVAFVLWDDSTDRMTFKSVRNYLELLKVDEPNIPVIFIRTKADIGSKEWHYEKEEINKLTEEFGIKNFTILNTSAKASLGCSDGVIIPEIVKLLGAQTEVAPAPSTSVAPSAVPVNKPAYEPSRFAHSRKIRFQNLEEMFNGLEAKDLFRRDVVWLLIHFISIDDRKSQTSFWIEKNIAARIDIYDPNLETYNDLHKGKFENIMMEPIARNSIPFSGVYYSLNDAPIPDKFPAEAPVNFGKNASRHLLAISNLLRLLSKRETSLKYKFTFFESSLAIANQEMKMILNIAKRMYDLAVGEVKPIQEGHNDNNAAPPSPRELFLKDILADAQIPVEIEEILSKWEHELKIDRVPFGNEQGSTQMKM